VNFVGKIRWFRRNTVFPIRLIRVIRGHFFSVKKSPAAFAVGLFWI
jgi:hypothetical protein